MNNFVEYTIKSGISLIVLYLFYWIVLRRGTHFKVNRLVLLFSLIVSMALPVVSSLFIKAPVVFEDLPIISVDFGTHTASSPAGMATGTYPVSPSSLWRTIFIIYISGAFVVFARLIYQAIFLKAVSRLSKQINRDGFAIFSISTEMVPFSYFRKIFIPGSKIADASFESIIAHEKSHMAQYHYVDLFFIEVITIFQWFNPIIWFYEKSIKEVHEYLADEAVLNTGKNMGNYQALLVNQALGGPVFLLTNQFNQSLIKKRIIMMKKMKTPKVAQLKALLIVPLIALLMLVFSSPDINGQTVKGGKEITVSGKVTDRVTGESIPGSIVCIKGTTKGTVADADGNYRIVTDNTSDVLVVSFIGYNTKELIVGTNSLVNIQLERSTIDLDFTKGNSMEIVAVRPDDVKEGNSAEEKYVVVEELPSYPGGTEALHKFLISSLKYPETARAKGIEGIVTVFYTINSDGKVVNTRILRGVSPDIDAEALRLTNSISGWKPASQHGKPISVDLSMPIEFSINK